MFLIFSFEKERRRIKRGGRRKLIFGKLREIKEEKYRLSVHSKFHIIFITIDDSGELYLGLKTKQEKGVKK